MTSISLYESEQIRETLTREQQKQICDIYKKVVEKAAKEAESLAGKDKYYGGSGLTIFKKN